MRNEETPENYAAALICLHACGVGDGLKRAGVHMTEGHTWVWIPKEAVYIKVPYDQSLRLLRDTLREVLFPWMNGVYSWGFTEGGEGRKGIWCRKYSTNQKTDDWFECHTLLQAADAVCEWVQKQEVSDE